MFAILKGLRICSPLTNSNSDSAPADYIYVCRCTNVLSNGHSHKLTCTGVPVPKAMEEVRNPDLHLLLQAQTKLILVNH